MNLPPISARLCFGLFLGCFALNFVFPPLEAATTSTIPNAIVPIGGKGLTISLGKYFPTPFYPTNAVVPSNSVYVNSSMGNFYIQLFPSNAPVTVANFLRYVNNGKYNNMIVDRLATNFFQSGGYLASNNLPAISDYGTITNEAGLSNVRGTLAMVLAQSNANSASSQWFVNTADNSALYDATNNAGNLPFTVFGQILGTNGTSSNGLSIVDAITSLPTANLNTLYSLGSQFGAVPLQNGWTSGNSVAFSNLVTVYSMAQIPSVSCSDTNSFSATIQGTNVVVKPLTPNKAPVTISISTLDTSGNLLTKSFQVSTGKLPQSIYFPVNETAYGTQPYIFNNDDISTNNPYAYYPYSSAGLGVGAQIVSGPAVVSIYGQLYLKGTGLITMRAYSPGNQFYLPASATGYIVVGRSTQTITFPSIPNQTNVTVPYKLGISSYPTASSFLPVTLSVSSGPAKITGAILTITNTGTITLTATQSGNANYYSATPVVRSFTVTK